MKLKHLQRDRALLMTSMLLVLMLGAGIFSGIVGFTLGHAALKGVTQPDIRLSNKEATDQNPKTRGTDILSEKKLLADAQALMGIKAGNSDKPDKFPSKDKPAVVFPIESKDQGIMMVVKSVKPEGTNLKVDMTIRNQGGQAAKFSQGALTAKDEQDKPIAANFTGLPQILAANGKDVVLKMTVLKTAVAKSKTISLNLTDVDKKLGLEVANIPVQPSVKINIPDGELNTVDDQEDQQKKSATGGVQEQNTGTPQRTRTNRSQPRARAQSNVNAAAQPTAPQRRSVKPAPKVNSQN
jgi:hypothetical protein